MHSPTGPRRRHWFEKTERLKTDAATKRVARNHSCGDPVKKTGNRKNHAYYVHEDFAVKPDCTGSAARGKPPQELKFQISGCEARALSSNMEDPRVVASKFRLTNEQSTLLTVLHGRSERIAQMYLGAIIAVNDGEDPERWCKAAHEIRELMMSMAEIADVEIRSLNESLGQKVAELEFEFDSMAENSTLKAPKWDGPTDQPMQLWLNKTTAFFVWKKTHNRRRRVEFTEVLRALDGPNRLLPAEIEESNVDSWMNTKSYFDKIAHHGSDAMEREFTERMAYVEGVLHPTFRS